MADSSRELLKALVGFQGAKNSPFLQQELRTVASGNWGAGAFGGSAAVKAVLQWMACSSCGLDLVYLPWDDDKLFSSLGALVAAVEKMNALKPVSVDMLYRALQAAAAREVAGMQRFPDDGVAFLAAVAEELLVCSSVALEFQD